MVIEVSQRIVFMDCVEGSWVGSGYDSVFAAVNVFGHFIAETHAND